MNAPSQIQRRWQTATIALLLPAGLSACVTRYSTIYAHEVHAEYNIAISSPTRFAVHGTRKADGSECVARAISGNVRSVKGDTINFSHVRIEDRQPGPTDCVRGDSAFVVLKEAGVSTVERRRTNDGSSGFVGIILVMVVGGFFVWLSGF